MIGSINPASKVNVEMRLGLRVIDGEFFGREFALPADRFVVGRGERSNLKLQSRRVSRAHCLFVRTDQHVFVADLRSRNGTWVNGSPIGTSTPLKVGDRVAIGSCVLQLIASPVFDDAAIDDDETTFLVAN